MPGYPRAWDRLFDDSPEGFALRRHLAAEEAKAARRARLVRAGRAGAKAGMVGGAAATGALAGSVIGSKLDRKKGGKKKMGSVVEKNLGLFARPMTMRRAKAAGRLARIKTDDAAVGAARGAGRATRYMNANAMPLVVGGSIGGGATMAGMQMNERRKMSKAASKKVNRQPLKDKKYLAYGAGGTAAAATGLGGALRAVRYGPNKKRVLAAIGGTAATYPLSIAGYIRGNKVLRGEGDSKKMSKSYVTVSRGAGEGLQRLARRSNALQAMKESADPAVAARGRMLSRRMSDGMKRRAAVQAGQVQPRVKKSLPSHLRRMSRKSPGMYKAPDTTYAGQRVAASQVGRLNPAAGRGLQASVGGELRAKSRVTLAQQGGRKRLRSPRNAAAMGLNSYRNPLRNV